MLSPVGNTSLTKTHSIQKSVIITSTFKNILNEINMFTFKIIWIVVWALIFSIFDDPSTGQIWGFIIIGILPPVIDFIRRAYKES